MARTKGERPFRCEICQKQFRSQGRLSLHHLDLHRFYTLYCTFSNFFPEKKFKCQNCVKAFGRGSSTASRRPFGEEVQVRDLRKGLHTKMRTSTASSVALERTIRVQPVWKVVSMALASYYKSLRMSLPNKVNLSMFEMSVQILWRFASISSRMLAMTLFIIAFDYMIVFVLLLHWLVMFLWVYSMNTNFCENSFEEACYDALVAIMFVFCYFNPIDNDTRYRYGIFFTVMLLENSCLLFFWYQACATRSNLPCLYKTELVSSYYLCFFFGVVICILYYLYCHPSRSIKFFRTESDLDFNRRRHSYVSRDQQRRVFDESDWATEEQITEIKRRLTDQLNQTDALDGPVRVQDIQYIGKVRRSFRRRRTLAEVEANSS